MHGTIYAGLKKYVLAQLGTDAWNQVLVTTQLSERIYDPSHAYPDEEAMRLAQALAQRLDRPLQEVLEDVGAFLAPNLLHLYRRHLNPRWGTLDLLEHTEQTIHRIVRVADPGARPPVLSAQRRSACELTLQYRSRRRLCAIARGIIRGTAEHFGETVEVTETRCQNQGAECCEMLVRRVAAACEADAA